MARASKTSTVSRWLAVPLIGLLGVCGLALALWVDRPGVEPDDGYMDAWRQVGGAIVAGSVLAAVVVWFEDRRDDQRAEREEVRADEATRKAWRREIDVRLQSVVRTDLDQGRREWLAALEADTEERSIIGSVASSTSRPVAGSIAEVRSLLAFLRDSTLSEAWSRWDESAQALEGGPSAARAAEGRSRRG